MIRRIYSYPIPSGTVPSRKINYLPVYRLDYKSYKMSFTQAYVKLAIAYRYNTEGIYWELVEKRLATSVSIIRSPVYFYVMKLYNENKELFNL